MITKADVNLLLFYVVFCLSFSYTYLIRGGESVIKTTKLATIFTLIFVLLWSGSPIDASAKTVTIDSEFINVRSGPGLTFEVTDKLYKGDQVKVTSTSGEWLQVTFENQTGWIASWLTAESDTTETASTIVSRVNSLNVRAEPSIGSAVLGRMNAGDEAVMTERVGDWARITLNGSHGWVHTDYISEITVENVGTPEKLPVTDDTYTVSVDALNVRKDADLSSKRVGLIHKDESYTVKEIDGNWVRIALSDKKEGWVYSFHGTLSTKKNDKQTQSTNHESVTILTDGTNIRQHASTSSPIVLRAHAGQQFTIHEKAGDWYEISLPTGGTAFVANWVVSSDNEQKATPKTPAERKKARVPGTLKGLTIVIDPGHGGNDRGTTGVRGTDEKNITLQTSELLAAKLKAAGATVELTRETDTYIPLRKRVTTSHQYSADAFISIHYDATLDSSVSGFTTYYTNPWQRELAQDVNDGLDQILTIRNRGAQPADFFVLRENKQHAILIELGFLSNASEERHVTTNKFREQATHGIYNGLLNYFNKQ